MEQDISKSAVDGQSDRTLLAVLLLGWASAAFLAIYAVFYDYSILFGGMFLWMFITVCLGFISSIFLMFYKKWAAKLMLVALVSVSVNGLLLWVIKPDVELSWWSVISVLGGFAVVQTNWHKLK
jgi:F0F1-type ATP synthase assembly protein I